MMLMMKVTITFTIVDPHTDSHDE